MSLNAHRFSVTVISSLFLILAGMMLFFWLIRPVYRTFHPVPAAADSLAGLRFAEGTMPRGGTFSSLLLTRRVPLALTENLTKAFSEVFDLRKCREGDRFHLVFTRRDTALIRFDYIRSVTEQYRIFQINGTLKAEKVPVRMDTSRVVISGILKTSLYQAVTDQGEDPELIEKAADMFAWSIDFYVDPRENDRFWIVADKLTVNGTPAGYGEIQAARYSGEVGSFTVIRFTDSDGKSDFFDEEGRSISSAFLKSPLKFTRISSRFGMRRHPILHTTRMHQGIDYTAPTGTPVWAIGPGKIVSSGWMGGYGKTVEIRHPNGMQSRYGHLSRIEPGLGPGTQVKEKEIIGAVGSTGLSTGPHLHFELIQNSRQVNPAQAKFRSAEKPVYVKNRVAFDSLMARWKLDLDRKENP